MALGSEFPVLWFKDIGAYDGFFRYSDPHGIELNYLVAQKFELTPNAPEAKQFVLAKTLHELVHWARHPNHPAVEAGVAFEEEAYQRYLPRFWETSHKPPAHGKPNISNLLPHPTNFERAEEDFTNEDLGADQPRGIRNNNPGNLKRTSLDWKGLAHDNLRDFQRTENVFHVFSEPEWGLRAAFRTLRTYQVKHQLRTVMQIISRWAPASDHNDTGAYVKAVADALEVTVHQTINVQEPDTAIKMLKAIIAHENKGQQPYSKSQLEDAYNLSL